MLLVRCNSNELRNPLKASIRKYTFMPAFFLALSRGITTDTLYSIIEQTDAFRVDYFKIYNAKIFIKTKVQDKYQFFYDYCKVNRFEYLITSIHVWKRQSASRRCFIQIKTGRFALTSQYTLVYFSQSIVATHHSKH